LAVANIGIAMGVAGSDVALETADIVLMGDRLPLIDYAFQLSRKARRVVWQNITFSLAVIGVLVVSVFAINLPLPFGVFGHEGSTVIVVLNGLFALLILPGDCSPSARTHTSMTLIRGEGHRLPPTHYEGYFNFLPVKKMLRVSPTLLSRR
jgi:Cd2+/Zn2+-exporting ATPase